MRRKVSEGSGDAILKKKKKEEASNVNRYLKARSFPSVGPEVMQSNGVWVLPFSVSSKHDVYISQVVEVF